jgi:hypothetical protein
MMTVALDESVCTYMTVSRRIIHRMKDRKYRYLHVSFNFPEKILLLELVSLCEVIMCRCANLGISNIRSRFAANFEMYSYYKSLLRQSQDTSVEMDLCHLAKNN